MPAVCLILSVPPVFSYSVYYRRPSHCYICVLSYIIGEVYLLSDIIGHPMYGRTSSAPTMFDHPMIDINQADGRLSSTARLTLHYPTSGILLMGYEEPVRVLVRDHLGTPARVPLKRPAGDVPNQRLWKHGYQEPDSWEEAMGTHFRIVKGVNQVRHQSR